MSQVPAAKMILMFKRKPGLSMEKFIEYYETKHVPFILSLSSRMSTYRRNYVQHAFLTAHADGAAGGGDPDVITEIHFATQADFDAFTTECNPHLDAVARDEANFVDRATIRGYLVTEMNSVLG